MEVVQSAFLVLVLLICAATDAAARINDKGDSITCTNPNSPCASKTVQCPAQCPYTRPASAVAHACYVDCNAHTCEAACKRHKPNCEGNSAACYDPRFIGHDGVAFYFHGSRGEHFALVSDPSIQVNARFIGHRPAGRPRDFTWIQALGIMSGRHQLTVEATRSDSWEETMDHLNFSFDKEPVNIPEGYRSGWRSDDGRVSVVRTGAKNTALVVVDDILEMSVAVVPVTEEDDRIHNYNIPAGDSYNHLEIQFRSLRLSSKVEGVIGRTYQPGFVNIEAKPGIEMPVVGGEENYRTTSLLVADCRLCLFDSTTDNGAESFAADN